MWTGWNNYTGESVFYVTLSYHAYILHSLGFCYETIATCSSFFFKSHKHLHEIKFIVMCNSRIYSRLFTVLKPCIVWYKDVTYRQELDVIHSLLPLLAWWAYTTSRKFIVFACSGIIYGCFDSQMLQTIFKSAVDEHVNLSTLSLSVNEL